METNYYNRLRKQGYTDEMLMFDALMEEIADREAKVRIVGMNGKEYIGVASDYTKPDDEDDGFSTVCISTDDKGGWCLGVNEIKSIEKI